MRKLIVITSGKGGVGKTTTAINLGAAVNHFGKDVLVVDGNLTTPNVGIHLGSPEVPVSLNHILSGKADVSEAVYEHESGVKIIPSSLSISELKKIKPEKMRDFKKDFKKISKYVIIDSAAGLGNEAISIIKMADELILVTNPEMPAITDALKTIKLAEQLKKPVVGIIITRVKKNNIEMQPETVREMLEVPILGMIPEDIDIQKSLSLKDAIVHTHPKSKPARAYKEIAAKILKVKYDSDEDRERLIERVLKRLGLKS
ncbi:septum site-determining protein MinD [Candidatus Pacearchaeota archaeon]|jgi:septum site-determining protein MinD|nr:septum site-determining protein MinD [Candidatus Pacearchaeota archaeon]|tara:strand:+ start:2383 stop:3159 length:777 start_codon:yes stop_codon:yes gene_type:complete